MGAAAFFFPNNPNSAMIPSLPSRVILRLHYTLCRVLSNDENWETPLEHASYNRGMTTTDIDPAAEQYPHTRLGWIYRLRDPRDGAIRYIGKTERSLAQRLRGHLDARCEKRYRDTPVYIYSVSDKELESPGGIDAHHVSRLSETLSESL